MASPTDFVPLKHSELPRPQGARIVGVRNPGEIAEVTLFIRAPKSAGPIEPLIERLGKTRVRNRQYLSREELAASQGADLDDLAKVERLANENNLAIEATSPSRRTVRVIGTLDNLSKAFNVKFSTYQSGRGAPYRGYEGSVSLPSELSDIVEGVFGLDTTPQSTFHLRKMRTTPQPHGAAAAAGPPYTPVDIANFYGFPTGLNGEGQCVGIIEFGGGYKMADLNAYFQMLGLPAPNIVAVSVAGGLNAPSSIPGGGNSADIEVMLDIEVVGSIAPAAQIVVYFAPNTTDGWLRAISTATNDSFHNPTVISISWGGPEDTWTRSALRAMNFEFAFAALRGITICAAAGDNGYTDGSPGITAHVDFPASSPWVLACGGTSLQTSDGSISSEAVWNDGPNQANPSSATGGGVSAFFPLDPQTREPAYEPAYYQKNAHVPVSVNPPNKAGRGVPDVAGDADPNTGYRVRVDGVNLWEVPPPLGGSIGGTSAVAPLWAGLLTLINQKLGKPLGHIHPLLYNQGAAAGAFNDITTGSNGAYYAGSGWDPCTGLGSPKGTVLSNIL
jgi:kumamolisin